MYTVKFFKNGVEFKLAAPTMGVLVMEVWNIWKEDFRAGTMQFLTIPVDNNHTFKVLVITRAGVKIENNSEKKEGTHA